LLWPAKPSVTGLLVPVPLVKVTLNLFGMLVPLPLPVQKVTLETAVSPVFKEPKIGKSAVLTHFSDVF
jgi:hypothetical protein